MAFRNSLKKITVDDERVEMQDYVTANEIIRKVGKDPDRYDLVRAYTDNTVELCRGEAHIRIREGFVFETQLTSING